MRRGEGQIACRGLAHSYVRRRQQSPAVQCQASQQAIADNGTTKLAANQPVPFQGGSLDVQCANLNAAVEFLREELPRIFEKGEVQQDRYDPNMVFVDPISQFSDLSGYNFNVRFLTSVFDARFELLDIGVTGPEDIVARWSMVAKFRLAPFLPWKPTAVFTGISEYKVDTVSGLITKHVDKWDSIEDNDFLSAEALGYIATSLAQANMTPDLETPDYKVLYKAARYEVRSYQPYLVSETPQPPGAGPASGSGFNELAGYIFGGNDASQSMAMTTPVFTRPAVASGDPQGAKMQFVMERRFSEEGLPAPTGNAKISTRTESGGIQAAITFPGFPLDFEVVAAERELRAALLRAGLRPKAGYSLARYNEPTIPPFLRRNEVLIELDDFKLPPLK